MLNPPASMPRSGRSNANSWTSTRLMRLMASPALVMLAAIIADPRAGACGTLPRMTGDQSTLRPLEDSDVDACARMMQASDPWTTLGTRLDTLAGILRNPDRLRVVAERDGTL